MNDSQPVSHDTDDPSSAEITQLRERARSLRLSGPRSYPGHDPAYAEVMRHEGVDVDTPLTRDSAALMLALAKAGWSFAEMADQEAGLDWLAGVLLVIEHDGDDGAADLAWAAVKHAATRTRSLREVCNELGRVLDASSVTVVGGAS